MHVHQVRPEFPNGLRYGAPAFNGPHRLESRQDPAPAFQRSVVGTNLYNVVALVGEQSSLGFADCVLAPRLLIPVVK
jgi:hypothetical protein